MNKKLFAGKMGKDWQAISKKKGRAYADKGMQAEIKANAKRISSNPNHPIMKQERAHSEGYRRD